MKNQVLLPESGYYKANLHCHTTLSDGHLTPEQTKAEYMAQGYSIVAFTDHRKYVHHTELDDENFLSLAALEVDLTQPREPGKDWPVLKCYHLNLVDTDPGENREQKQGNLLPEFPYDDLESLNQYIAKMSRMGFLVTYNHPYWSLQDWRDYSGLKGLFAMEIYNHGCEHDGLYGFNPQVYDEMLRTGQRLYALATDDNHDTVPIGQPLNDSFGGFVQIAAEKLTYPAVIEALRKGRFYWSQGPELKGVSIEDGVLRVKTSPVEKIFVTLEGRDSYKAVVAPGESLTEAAFPLTGKEGWFRIQVRDSRGLFAGTNAYFVDQL
ncbi:MAG: hypothetical protein ACOYJZ_09715 [Acutalibacter sp.]